MRCIDALSALCGGRAVTVVVVRRIEVNTVENFILCLVAVCDIALLSRCCQLGSSSTEVETRTDNAETNIQCSYLSRGKLLGY